MTAYRVQPQQAPPLGLKVEMVQGLCGFANLPRTPQALAVLVWSHLDGPLAHLARRGVGVLHSSPAANPSFLAYWPYPILNCLQFQPFVSISEIHPSSLSTHYIQKSIFSRPRTIHSLNFTLLNSTAASQNEVHYLDHPGLDPGGRPGWQRRASCSSPQDSHSLGASFAQRLWCRQFVCPSVFPFGCAV